MNSVTLLLGGARSGKSDLAVEIGQRFEGAVTFIATAARTDAEMVERIERHQADRPPWPTIEVGLDLHQALLGVPSSDLVIVDCLTLWVASTMLAGWDDDAIMLSAADAACIAVHRDAPTVVVSNEVGLGVHPETELGRDYRDVLGGVNRQWARRAQQTLLLVAGRAVRLHDPWEFVS